MILRAAFYGRLVVGLGWSAILSSTAIASARIPVPDGTYCGPGTATVTVDSGADTVRIEGYTCGFPIFAADKLQSIQCRRDNGPPQRHEFAVRVLNGALLYNDQWFRRCTP